MFQFYVDATVIYSFIPQQCTKLCHCAGCCRRCKDEKRPSSVSFLPNREIKHVHKQAFSVI